MGFRISGLPLESFQTLFSLDAAGLEAAGVVEFVVDEERTWPCRISLQDATLGERALLLNYPHLSTASPYAASGPIVVRCAATRTRVALNQVPEQQRIRLLSVRAFDARDWIVAGDVVPGAEVEGLIEQFFADPRVAYLHLHNARYGCYAARVDRA